LLLDNTISSIGPLDVRSMDIARKRLDSLTKPPGSLGRLEELVIRLTGIYGDSPVTGRKVVVMAGDHGIAEEGVSAYPQEVTAQMVNNFLNGGAAINVLARCSGAEVVVVDVGVKAELNGNEHENFYSYKVRRGTNNMILGPAMTRQEAVRAVEAGVEVVNREVEKGAVIIATGEMGIGNTTPSSAILSVIAGLEVEKAVGRGTGINDDALENKRLLIKKAIELHNPSPENPLDVLSKVGGLEIAGLTGVILGAAARRVPVVIDGFISGAAAMLAVKLAPACRDYIFPSHLSGEPGHRTMLEWLGLKPIMMLDMKLGEGTGAALALHIIDASIRIYHEMATFEEASVSRGNNKKHS